MDSDSISEVIGNIMKLSNSVLNSIVPDDARRHFHSACKETLLGMIAILDSYDENHKNHVPENAHQEEKSSHTINISD